MARHIFSIWMLAAAVACSGTANAQTAAPPPRLAELLAEASGDVEQMRLAWQDADAARAKAANDLEIFKRRDKRDADIRKELGLPPAPPNLATAEADKELTALVQKADSRKLAYEAAAAQLKEYARLAAGQGRPLTPSVTTLAGASAAPAPTCSLEGARDLAEFDTRECERRFAFRKPPPSGPGGAGLSISDRVADTRGISAQLLASSTSSAATIKLSDVFNWRRPPAGSGSVQQVWNWNYSIGVEAQISEGAARIGGIRETDLNRRIGDLDQLDGGLKFTGSLGFAVFPKQDIAADAAKMRDAARLACLAEQRTAPADAPIECVGEPLTRWIFANATHAAAYQSVYWGSARKVAEYGGGLTFAVARPEYAYYPFRTLEVPNPLLPGKTKTIIDTSYLPPGFLTDSPVKARHVTGSIGGYLFRFFPFHPSAKVDQDLGVALIPSATYKWDREKATEFQICPVASGPLATTELCRAARAADATEKNGAVFAMEARLMLPGTRLFGRLPIPRWALAPKFSFDDADDRKAIDMPLYFALDDKGGLSGGLRFAWEWGGQKAGADRKPASAIFVVFGTTFDLTKN